MEYDFKPLEDLAEELADTFKQNNKLELNIVTMNRRKFKL